jgi:hypothetical protein
MIHEKSDYYFLPEIDKEVINLEILLLNRQRENIYLLSNNSFHLSTALIARFGIVPIPCVH